MFVIRKDSPLVIGKGIDENYISSDIPAILSFTKDFYLLNDYEIAVLSSEKIEFYDIDLNLIQKEPKNIAWDVSSAEKDGYEDFMLKEIFEQPKSIRETIGARIALGSKCSLDELDDFTKEYLNIICGQIVGKLFQTSRCTCRFHIPIFSAGGHSIESWSPHHSVLHYSNPCNECVQFIHQLSFVPISDGLTSMSAKG